MKSNTLQNHRKQFSLSKKQREIVIGLILGDGHLETQNGRTYRLKIEHGIAQKEYVDWLYEQFKDFVGTPPRFKNKLSFGKPIVSYGFATYSSASFRFYAQQFYNEKKKVIPRFIERWLTPMALAIWYMDDGSKKSNEHRTYILHTLGYTRRELEIVVSALEKKFGVALRIHNQYNGLRLYVLSESAEKFSRIIEPYILPSMRYKLSEHVPKK